MPLNYKKLGEGKPLVILHGLFGMLDNWQSLGRRFAEHFTVYLIDQRNHGKSPHSLEFDYYVMADDLVAFVEEQELESFYLLGHSMGGKTAMQFAVDQAEAIEKLIVVDIAPIAYPVGHQDIFKALFSINVAALNSRKEAEQQLATFIEEVGVQQFLLKNLKRNKIGGYIWKFNLEAIHHSYTDIIANSLTPYDQCDAPTLFIKGGQSDRYIDVARDLPTLQHHFPNATLQTIEQAGHWVHAEQPDVFFEQVMHFLSSS